MEPTVTQLTYAELAPSTTHDETRAERLRANLPVIGIVAITAAFGALIPNMNHTEGSPSVMVQSKAVQNLVKQTLLENGCKEHDLREPASRLPANIQLDKLTETLLVRPFGTGDVIAFQYVPGTATSQPSLLALDNTAATSMNSLC